MNPLPNFHLPVPAWALFLVLLAGVGIATFGDPTAFGAPAVATPIFKAVSAMFDVALGVMVVNQKPAA